MAFNIGDKVWRASFETAERHVKCPDCAGSRRIKAIIADGTEYSIDCRACERGWEGSRGYIMAYERKPQAVPMVIGGIEQVMGRPIEYKFNVTPSSWNSCDEDVVFATEAEAMARAEQLAAEQTAKEDALIYRKEKDTKSWAWHVTYYRRMIRDAKADIERAEKKLGIAQSKTKENAA